MATERCLRCGVRVGWVGLVVDSALVAMKLVVGMETGSRAMMADSLYSLFDVVSSILVIVSVKASRKQVDAEHPYGYGKVEFLGIAAVSICIAIFAVLLLHRAVLELIHGEHRRLDPLAAVAAVFAILACALMWRYAHCAAEHLGSPVLETDAEHHKADALSSLLVLGGIMLSWVGLGVLDPLVAVVENVHIGWMSVSMLRRGVDGLLDASADAGKNASIARIVRRVPGVVGVDHVHARTLGSSTWIELRVRVAPKRRMSEISAIRSLIRTAIGAEIQHVSNVMIEVLPAVQTAPRLSTPLHTERGIHG